MSGPHGPLDSPYRLPLNVADMLLLVILALGSARVLLPVVAGALGLGNGIEGVPIEKILILLGVQTGLLLLAVYLVVVLWRGVSWRDLGFVPLPEKWGARAVAIALLSFPLVGFIIWVQQQITGREFENPQMELIAPAEFSLSAYLTTLIVVAVIAPLAEEVLFRGVLYRWLRERIGIGFALVLSSLAFSVVHGVVALIPAIAVLGLILGWVYERTQSIWTPILVHAIYNAIVTTILYAALAQDMAPPGT